MSGICTILWAIFVSALFSSNSWKPLPSRCNPLLYAKGASEPARIIVQIPLMEWLMAALDTGGEVEERLDLIQ
jgi:hypothetical protein